MQNTIHGAKYFVITHKVEIFFASCLVNFCYLRGQIEKVTSVSSVQSLSRLRPRESQHSRPPCPSPEFTQTHVHRVPWNSGIQNKLYLD